MDRQKSEAESLAFDNMCEVVLKYVNTFHHPHTTIIVTTDRVEVVEGVKTHVDASFIPD